MKCEIFVAYFKAVMVSRVGYPWRVDVQPPVAESEIKDNESKWTCGQTDTV